MLAHHWHPPPGLMLVLHPFAQGGGYFAFIWGHLLLNQSSNKLLHPLQAVAAGAPLLAPGVLPLVHGPLQGSVVIPELCRTIGGSQGLT